jgi:hypothetical protein
MTKKNGNGRDAKYLELLLEPMRECAKYKPAFGKAKGEEEVGLNEFRALYGADPLYHWVGLDSDLMYAAHKAAGGMTSIYRQLGIGCERLLREVVKDELNISSEEAAWSYEYEKEDGKNGRHTLDIRIDHSHLSDVKAASRVRSWLKRAGEALDLKPARVSSLRGAVFEVRQGYKSADSKRQNADLRFGMRAANDDYLPVICIVSTQASETVCRRYRNSALLVLVGSIDIDTVSTFSFYRDVVGYDLAAFFTRNSPRLREEFGKVLKGLLTPS